MIDREKELAIAEEKISAAAAYLFNNESGKAFTEWLLHRVCGVLTISDPLNGISPVDTGKKIVANHVLDLFRREFPDEWEKALKIKMISDNDVKGDSN